MKKLKREIMLTLEINICEALIEKKRNTRKIITIKEKKLNCLIICAEEFENASLNKKSGKLSHKKF